MIGPLILRAGAVVGVHLGQVAARAVISAGARRVAQAAARKAAQSGGFSGFAKTTGKLAFDAYGVLSGTGPRTQLNKAFGIVRAASTGSAIYHLPETYQDLKDLLASTGEAYKKVKKEYQNKTGRSVPPI